MDSNKKNEISNSVSEICENFSMLTDNIDKIDRKIEFITKIFYKLSYNATLDTSDTNSYLKFFIFEHMTSDEKGCEPKTRTLPFGFTIR